MQISKNTVSTNKESDIGIDFQIPIPDKQEMAEKEKWKKL